MMPGEADWPRERLHVLATLDRIDERLGRIDEKFDAHRDRISGQLEAIRVDIAVLQVKAGVWGGLAGLVSSGLIAAAMLWGGK